MKKLQHADISLQRKMNLFLSVSEEISHPTPESSPEMTKRSWFSSLMSTEKEETYTIIVKGKGLSTIKADLVQAFLSVSCSFLIITIVGI